MNPETLTVLQAAQETVTRLVAACDKSGSLYRQHPKHVAQISRTSKWLLNAIAQLNQAAGTDNEAIAS